MNLFLPLKKKSLIHRFHLCHEWTPSCWIKLCNLLQQVQLLKNVMITALTQLFSSLWIETSKIHIFVHTLYIAECAMDLNFSFSPSPNKRTRQTTGLDRLEPNFTLCFRGWFKISNPRSITNLDLVSMQAVFVIAMLGIFSCCGE